ncbi:glycoside hydrolase family 17 protein, partial [Dissoconium aciculare CBS 342.82]|uniref:glucan endo-1,3-beta-D-glucosidase n=1 Tax=Dissoconium aciculare CBS 342.82 TaxID=1314786 RepID=A0A6J3M6J6_9PEZI
QEKSEWLKQQSSGQKRLRWLVGVGIAVIVVLAIAGGIVGGVLGSRKASQSNGDGNSGGVTVSQGSSQGLWDMNTREIKAVMGNKNFHKVFPTMDYTPLNAQYPACLTNPPDQNNVTLDIAILSQLTPAVRLYGTDCNQTAMVLEAIDRLGMSSSMKVWLGVYLDGNTTTNERQVEQMYGILDKYPSSRFAGIIVGNEVLFGKYLTVTQLATQLQAVRTKLATMKIELTVSTADLGEAWKNNPDLASSSDIVMANVHPFFAGVKAEQGTSWAWTYWQSIVALPGLKTGTVGGSSYPKRMIGEIGWPTQGGHHCGGQDANYGCVTSDDGAVASIANLNTFMSDWVCAALTNGTNYFWFEAFDEQWKHRFDTPANNWEPYWGLMDHNRNLKKGLVIPDCGGRTV